MPPTCNEAPDGRKRSSRWGRKPDEHRQVLARKADRSDSVESKGEPASKKARIDQKPVLPASPKAGAELPKHGLFTALNNRAFRPRPKPIHVWLKECFAQLKVDNNAEEQRVVEFEPLLRQWTRLDEKSEWVEKARVEAVRPMPCLQTARQGEETNTSATSPLEKGPIDSAVAARGTPLEPNQQTDALPSVGPIGQERAVVEQTGGSEWGRVAFRQLKAHADEMGGLESLIKGPGSSLILHVYKRGREPNTGVVFLDSGSNANVIEVVERSSGKMKVAKQALLLFHVFNSACTLVRRGRSVIAEWIVVKKVPKVAVKPPQLAVAPSHVPSDAMTDLTSRDPKPIQPIPLLEMGIGGDSPPVVVEAATAVTANESRKEKSSQIVATPSHDQPSDAMPDPTSCDPGPIQPIPSLEMGIGGDSPPVVVEAATAVPPNESRREKSPQLAATPSHVPPTAVVIDPEPATEDSTPADGLPCEDLPTDVSTTDVGGLAAASLPSPAKEAASAGTGPSCPIPVIKFVETNRLRSKGQSRRKPQPPPPTVDAVFALDTLEALENGIGETVQALETGIDGDSRPAVVESDIVVINESSPKEAQRMECPQLLDHHPLALDSTEQLKVRQSQPTHDGTITAETITVADGPIKAVVDGLVVGANESEAMLATRPSVKASMDVTDAYVCTVCADRFAIHQFLREHYLVVHGLTDQLLDRNESEEMTKRRRNVKALKEVAVRQQRGEAIDLDKATVITIDDDGNTPTNHADGPHLQSAHEQRGQDLPKTLGGAQGRVPKTPPTTPTNPMLPSPDLDIGGPPTPRRAPAQSNAFESSAFSNGVLEVHKDVSDSNYEIYQRGLLGDGQFGRVYLARNRLTKRKVAVKLVEIREQTRNEQDAMLHESRMLGRIGQHPGIVGYSGLVQNKDVMYLVLEKMRGDLLNIINNKQGERLTERFSRLVIFQLLSAIQYLHQRNIVHCDLKPENVLVSLVSLKVEDCVMIKLCDFGFSQVIAPGRKLCTRDSGGTFPYMAPELFDARQKYDRAVDLWATGVIAYIALFNVFPFHYSDKAGNNDEKKRQQLRKRFKDYEKDDDAIFKSVRNLTSEQAIAFIAHLLAVKQKTRPTVEEALRHEWLSGEQLHADVKQLETKRKIRIT